MAGKKAKGTGKKKKRKDASDADEALASARPASRAASVPAAAERTWKRHALVALAGFFLADVWLDAVGSTLPGKILPRSLLYFGQIAALFPHAGEKQIDYRAEGYRCSDHKWVEIDPRPWFPIDADNKENRFYRAVQFYRENRKVMRALDEYIVSHYNKAHDDRIGGVRILSLRIPLPAPGTKIDPYKREELAKYPEDQRHNWYWSPGSMRRERCGSSSSKDKDDEDEK